MSVIQDGSQFGGSFCVSGQASVHQGGIVNIYRSLNQCLRDLRIIDPSEDKKRIQESKGRLLTKCYDWVLWNSDFQKWRKNQDQRLLWVNGNPGKGKTMLLCGIIDELGKKPKEPPGILTSYFFCQATDERHNTATAVLRGLMYMLLVQEESLISHVQKRYNHAGKALFEDVNAWHAMSTIFTNMLKDPKLQGISLIVDALDECSTDLEQLLDLIKETSKSTKCSTKWLVSSRNFEHIKSRLGNAAQQLSLEANSALVSSAVDSYIKFKIKHLSQLRGYQDDAADEIREHLSSNADGTFLWVALVLQNLEKTDWWNALDEMKSFPPGLDALYDRMMQDIDEKRDAELCRKILALLVTSYRPLSLAELTIFIEDNHAQADNPRFIRSIVGSCGSFIYIRMDTIYFVHQSARDFLMNETYPAFSRILPSGIVQQHQIIFSRSMKVLSRTLQRDIYELHNHESSMETISPPALDPLASLKYSSAYWVDHFQHTNLAKNSARDDSQNKASVQEFLECHLLHWLEAQSLVRGMPQAVTALQKLRDLVSSTETQLAALVNDACRFVLSFNQCIGKFPLQLYVAGHLFSPSRSLTRKLFQTEAPAWITVLTEVNEAWNACLQTLEGHDDWVNSVAFSADRRQLASASSDKTIRLWDTATGRCEQTLKGHDKGVTSVAFSASNGLLASASEDTTIRIWETDTGHVRHILRGHNDWVNSVAFSADGQQVASASSDTTIRLWDSSTGECLWEHCGRNERYQSVVFISHGQQLASASSGKTIQIWDAVTRQFLRTLHGHNDPVRSVVFSDDRQQLASASDDKTIKLWDTIEDQCQQTIQGHSDCAQSVTFLDDKQQLASASSDNTIKLWNADTGECLQVLKGHSGAVLSVASGNGRQLASASKDKTIRLWDAAIGQGQRTLESHHSWIRSVTFSPDGMQLASASETIKLWDTATGQCQQTLKGDTSWFDLVVFSADRKQLASATHKTIRLWDIAIGQCRRMDGHDLGVTLMAFSPDGTQLASASADKTIRLWDTATGQSKHTLTEHHHISMVVFSVDGKQLSSTSVDSEPIFWDTATGKCMQMPEGHSSLGNVFGTTIQDPSEGPGYSCNIFSDPDVWITYNSQNILWLPPEYRGVCRCIHGSKIAIGCRSGRVLLVEVKLDS